MRDHVVQLPRDAGALLEHGLVSGQVALPLGQLRTYLAIAYDAAHDQHHYQRAQRPQRTLTVHRAGDEIGDEDRCHPERELTGRRPHSEAVQRAQVGDGIREHLRVSADRDAEPHRDPRAGAREGRVAASIRDGQAQSRGEQRGPQPLLAGDPAGGDLELAGDRQHQRERPVELHRVRTLVPQIAKAHLSTVMRFDRPVIIGCSYTVPSRNPPTGRTQNPRTLRRHPQPGLLRSTVSSRIGGFACPARRAVGSIFTDRRRLLTALATALGLIELADAPTISFWEGALAFGILYLAGAQWTRRGSVGGPILVGALSAFEIQGFFQWARGGTVDWVAQIGVLMLSTLALIVALPS